MDQNTGSALLEFSMRTAVHGYPVISVCDDNSRTELRRTLKMSRYNAVCWFSNLLIMLYKN